MAPSRRTLPRVGDLPGVGGRLKEEPEDFVVEEVSLYDRSGDGPHLWLWVEKRDVPGGAALSAIARAFGCRQSDVGSAGTKDRRAVTRQWFSVLDEQGDFDAERALETDLGDGMRVLEVSRHQSKLRTGHLRGNRFDILIRGVGPDADKRAAATTELLSARGMANYYGPQRFGRDGDNAEVAMAMLRGESVRRGRFQRKMLVSALQSRLFNDSLVRRLERGDLDRVLDGDVMKKRDTGGLFVVDDVEREQARFAASETVHTGPMFGHRVTCAERVAGGFESEVLAEHGLRLDDFRKFGKLARGTRRENLVFVEELTVELEDDGLRLGFFLPKGSYATVLLDEVMGFGCR